MCASIRHAPTNSSSIPRQESAKTLSARLTSARSAAKVVSSGATSVRQAGFTRVGPRSVLKIPAAKSRAVKSVQAAETYVSRALLVFGTIPKRISVSMEHARSMVVAIARILAQRSATSVRAALF